MKKPLISFPHLGNYSVPIYYFLSNVTKMDVMIAPNITKRTIELGSKYSPDFVCLPFKYNLGNFIEALENNANILFQAGGGCRYGCYGEVQKQILNDLGYDFMFISLLDDGKLNMFSIYKAIKKLNPKIKFLKYLYYLINTMLMIYFIDKIENYTRLNVGFEIIKNSFKNTNKRMLNEFKQTKGIIDLFKKYHKYKKAIRKICESLTPDDEVKKVVRELA